MTDQAKEKIEEGRKLLEALGESMSEKSQWYVLLFMAGIGLAHLRAAKASMDMAKAAQEMGRRIQAGPRPSPEEAGLN